MALFFFTGEERYLLHHELQIRKERFAHKYGKTNIHVHNIRDESDAIAQSLMGGGLFSDKALVIIHDVPPPTGVKSHADRFIAHTFPLLKTISPSCIVVCVSSTPDKRTKLYKEIKSIATIKEFKTLGAAARRQFVVDIYGDTLPNDTIQSIIEYCGNDLARIANDVTKLRHYVDATNTSITQQTIENVCVRTFESNAFVVLDSLVHDPLDSIHHLSKLKNQGQDIYQIMGMMLWGIRNAIAITHLTHNGETQANAIAKKLGVAPFVVAKQLKRINTYRNMQNRFAFLFCDLVDIDAGIKSGIYDAGGVRSLIKASIYKHCISDATHTTPITQP